MDEVEELKRALSFYKAQYDRLKTEVFKLKRVLRAMKNAGAQFPHWASDLNLDEHPYMYNGVRRVDVESMRRLVYRAALEAYRKLSRPVKPSEVQGEVVKLSIYVGIDPPSRATVAKMLRQLSSKEHYGCEPPLLKVDEGYIPKEACQERFNTLDVFI